VEAGSSIPFNSQDRQLPAWQRDREHWQQEDARERERPDHVPHGRGAAAKHERCGAGESKHQCGLQNDVSHG
jgi:hypothetical protein